MENVLRPIAENVLRPIAENVLHPIAENVLRPIAENVLRSITENVLRPIAENSQRHMERLHDHTAPQGELASLSSEPQNGLHRTTKQFLLNLINFP